MGQTSTAHLTLAFRVCRHLSKRPPLGGTGNWPTSDQWPLTLTTPMTGFRLSMKWRAVPPPCQGPALGHMGGSSGSIGGQVFWIYWILIFIMLFYVYSLYLFSRFGWPKHTLRAFGVMAPRPLDPPMLGRPLRPGHSYTCSRLLYYKGLFSRGIGPPPWRHTGKSFTALWMGF